MRCIGYGVDKLERKNVRQLIQDTFKTSPGAIVVYLREDPVSETSPPTIEAVNPFVQEQETHESFRTVRKWNRRGCPPNTKNHSAYPG